MRDTKPGSNNILANIGILEVAHAVIEGKVHVLTMSGVSPHNKSNSVLPSRPNVLVDVHDINLEAPTLRLSY